MPTMNRILSARKKLDDFQWYCDNFLSVVVGRQAFNKQKFKMLVSKMATRSDEALMLIIVENSIERWTNEFKHPAADAKTWGDPKYTKSDKNETRKHRGWSEEGIVRFNKYLKEYVPASRQTSEALEEELKDTYCNKHGTGTVDGAQTPTAHSNKVHAFMELESDEE